MGWRHSLIFLVLKCIYPYFSQTSTDLFQELLLDSREFLKDILPIITTQYRSKDTSSRFSFTRAQLVHNKELTEAVTDQPHWIWLASPIFASFVGRLVNTPLVACHSCGWRVYTQSFLGVHGVTVGWPRTNGTANNERVHSFCWFLHNPFIVELFFWRSSQLSRGLLISVRYAVCSTRCWLTCRPLLRAC